MFQASAMGIMGLFAVAMCWALAVVLYRVGESGSVARKLALLLVVEGITLLSAGKRMRMGLDTCLERGSGGHGSHPRRHFCVRLRFSGYLLGLDLYPGYLANPDGELCD